MPEPISLVSSAAAGDRIVCLSGAVPGPCRITLGPGTPYRESALVYRCTGVGPHVAMLGLSAEFPMRLSRPHCDGTTVEVGAFDYRAEAPRRPHVFGRVTGLLIVGVGPEAKLAEHVGDKVAFAVEDAEPQVATLTQAAYREDMEGTVVLFAPFVVVPLPPAPYRLRVLDDRRNPVFPGEREAVHA